MTQQIEKIREALEYARARRDEYLEVKRETERKIAEQEVLRDTTQEVYTDFAEQVGLLRGILKDMEGE